MTKNKVLIFIIVTILLFVTLYLSNNKKSEFPIETQDPYIIGEIYSISENKILVAEGLEGEEYTGEIDELKGKAIWVSVNEKTEIVGMEDKFIQFNELQERSEVEVYLTGVILESYPAQGTAVKIKVTKEPARELTVSDFFSIIPGHWQSKGDQNSIIIFEDDGTFADFYDQKKINDGIWELYKNESAEYNPSGFFMRKIIDNEAYEYAIVEIEKDLLLLNYLNRGNMLEYERLK